MIVNYQIISINDIIISMAASMYCIDRSGLVGYRVVI